MGLLIKAFIMGVVEGLTEFLPVSSTGHMIIVGDFIDFKGESFQTMFEIVIQLGAILAVIFYYRDKIIDSYDTCGQVKEALNCGLKYSLRFCHQR